MKERDLSIDLMRAIGLLCVILAHVNPPATLMQIRCFDVPLMLFVSGLVFSGRKPNFRGVFDYQDITPYTSDMDLPVCSISSLSASC